MQLRATRLTAIASAARRLFSPDSLFSAGEQGAWYDPSDLTTLFQDSAGTTPVTAVEQPVGLMLDKSKGLVLGSELVTNGTFDTNTNGWTTSAGTFTSVGGRGVFSSTVTSYAYQSFATVVGVTYVVEASLISFSGGAFRGIRKADNFAATANVVTFLSGTGSTKQYFTATATTTFIIVQLNGTAPTDTVTVDNISIKALPGNHAFQSTSTSRPVLSARVNLLTRTEQFNDVVWAKNESTVLSDQTTAPNGALTADKLIPSTATASHWVNIAVSSTTAQCTGTLYVKLDGSSVNKVTLYPGGAGTFANFNLGSLTSAGEVNVTATSITPIGDGWYRLSATWAAGITITTFRVYASSGAIGAANNPGDGTSGIFIWGADLRTSNVGTNLPVYQRVNTVTDYDTAGFPLYLACDGVDDWMQTNSIDFSATDKMTVVAGVRKLSDATTGMLVELSADLNVNNGTFYLAAPVLSSGTRSYGLVSKGTIQAPAFAGVNTFPAPITSVLSSTGDISGDSSILRVNGTPAVINSGDQGTGNYGNYPLYLFRRGGTTVPFNGRFYGLIVRGAATSASQIAQAEAWMNQRTRAF